MIDQAVEALVREVYNAVIVGDERRFEEAIKAIPDNEAEYAFKLTLAIDRTAMADLHTDIPSDDRLESLARQFVGMQKWSNPERLPVLEFLRFIAGRPTEPMSAEVRGLLAFLVGGWLLAAFLNSGNHWYEYLDEILDRLNSLPEDSWIN